uniref:RPA-interacting protein N-terminal domain-containing protein n=1 Tax=Opuntia streptacantha TaxID=393608 RepID=A0A7C8YHD6_OPUST
MEGKKKQFSPARQPLKTLNLYKLHKDAHHHITWKEKLRESCCRRVREDRSRLLWKLRLPLRESGSQKGCIKSALQEIVSDELKRIKDQSSCSSELPSSLSGEDDVLWEYDGLHEAYQGECEEILLEMQRIFYEDIKMELCEKEVQRPVILDEEDEYLAAAVEEYMQLNDGKVWKERTWCPLCKKGELLENRHLIYCSLCQLKLNRGDEVNLSLLRDRLAEAHEEHLDRNSASKLYLI